MLNPFPQHGIHFLKVPAGGLGVYLSDSAAGRSRVAQAWPRRLWWRVTGGTGPEVRTLHPEP